jgi:hypothetical protein
MTHRPSTGDTTRLTPIDVGPDGFIPETLIDGWSRKGRARRVGGVLWVEDERVHDVVDAVRILGLRHGEGDPYGWAGRVFQLRELIRLGAAISPEGVRLGHTTYDIEFGVVVEARALEEAAADSSGPLRPSRPTTGRSGLIPAVPADGRRAG